MPTSAKAVILVNKGGGSAGDDAGEKVSAALKAAGIDGKVEPLDGGKLVERARAAVAVGAPLIIAAGGDGTQSAVARATSFASTTSSACASPAAAPVSPSRSMAKPWNSPPSSTIASAPAR